VLDPSSVVREAELFVAVEVDAGPQRAFSEARVRVASAVRREWLEMLPAALRVVREIVFDAERERVVERRRELFADLVLSETVQLDVDRLRAGGVLAEAARQDPAAALRIDAATQRWLQRLRFVQRWMPELGWSANSDAWFADIVADLCAGRRSFAELRASDVLAALRGMLTPAQRQRSTARRRTLTTTVRPLDSGDL